MSWSRKQPHKRRLKTDPLRALEWPSHLLEHPVSTGIPLRSRFKKLKTSIPSVAENHYIMYEPPYIIDISPLKNRSGTRHQNYSWQQFKCGSFQAAFCDLPHGCIHYSWGIRAHLLKPVAICIYASRISSWQHILTKRNSIALIGLRKRTSE